MSQLSWYRAIVLLLTSGLSVAAAKNQTTPLRFAPIPSEAIYALPKNSGTYRHDGTLLEIVNGNILRARRWAKKKDIALPLAQNQKTRVYSYGDVANVDVSDSLYEPILKFLVHLPTSKVHTINESGSLSCFSYYQLTFCNSDKFSYVIDAAGTLISHPVSKNSWPSEGRNTKGQRVYIIPVQQKALVFLDEMLHLTLHLPQNFITSECSLENEIIRCRQESSENDNDDIQYALLDGQHLNTSGKKVLSYDPQKHRAVIMDGVSESLESITSGLKVIDLNNGSESKIMDQANMSDRFHMIMPVGTEFLLWLKDGSAVFGPAKVFWDLYEGKEIDLEKLQNLGKAKDMVELTQVFNENVNYFYSSLFSSDSDWSFSDYDNQTLIWENRDPSKRTEVTGLKGMYAKMIPNSDFAVFENSSLSQTFSILYNFRTKTAYELGFGHVEVGTDESAKDWITFSGTDNFLLSLSKLGQKPDQNAWRKKPIELAQRPPLSKNLLTQCSDNDLSKVKTSLASRLLQWRKPRVKVSEADLKSLLQYQLNKDESHLLAHVLQRRATDLAGSSIWWRKYDLYQRILPYAWSLTENPCLESQQSQIDSYINQQFEPFTSQQGSPIDIHGFGPLLVYGPAIRRLGLHETAKRDHLIEKLALSATAHPLLNGIFASKLYYLSKAITAPLFGEKQGFYTDLTLLNRGRSAEIHLLSTDFTTGERTTQTSFGFQVMASKSISLAPNSNPDRREVIQWRSNGRLFKGVVDVKKTGDLKEFAPPSHSPNYDLMMADSKITGAMVIGTNAGKDVSDLVFNSYQRYYKFLGFSFENPRREDQSLNFLKNGITTGDFDYLIKEAHSDGDEKNLFRAAQSTLIWTGSKTDSSGQEHIIHLIRPFIEKTKSSGSPLVGDDVLISNQEFGDWIRDREQRRTSSLIYINASCSSLPKALNEITAARSKAITIIPSLTTVYFYTNGRNNPKEHLVRGIHEFKDWASIRKNMDTNLKAKDGVIDVYALPHEDSYEKSVRERLGVTVDAKIEIFDERTGQRIETDQFNEHH